MDARRRRLRHDDAAVASGRGPRPREEGRRLRRESDGPGPGVDAMPSFLASVAETHSVSCPVRPTKTPLPGAAAVLAARQAVDESPGPAYDTARAYNATHKARAESP